ncbi:hypothetical protein [Bacillus sp. 3255]|uniref:DUF7210 family protein n=1 Tax=Bacillus sp. 3255 TaxID=2817904 RepID=UPI0028599736|nr:hypothetical protein [Bacillus sp. 3255]MDR6883787.1 hypothetical protein [Bacillus sp. 3255]
MTVKSQEEKPKTVRVKFKQNVKYRGAYYSAGTTLEVLTEDKRALLKDGVITSGADEDVDDDQ